MRRCDLGLLACWLTIAVCGCNSATQSSQPPTQSVQARDLVGTWRLVRAGGQPPSALNIKSLQIAISADGLWASEIEMTGEFAGMNMKGGGKWSLANDTVSYTSGANSGKSKARLESGR